jgi:RNA polymerase sigma-70 factor (ECF subfamily)
MATLTLARSRAATAPAGYDAVDDRTARPDAARPDAARPDFARPDPGADARDRRLARARGGDLDAFADLVRHHQRLVFGIACRMLADRAAAEDLAQDVFVQLHRHLATIESDAHLGSWLRRVVTHRAIDAVRERKRRPVTPLDAVAEPASAAVAAERDPLLVSWLRGQVAALPAAARAVVVLRYQRELGPVEIAETLDMPLNTVKSHLKRSLAVLRARCARVRHG